MRLVTSALILALISPVAFAARLYRFNVDGQMIMKDHVPPEYERSGQEIPVDMRLEIAQLQNQIRESHSNIKTRNMEKVESTKVYAEEYSRMQILLKYPPGTLESDIPLDALD